MMPQHLGRLEPTRFHPWLALEAGDARVLSRIPEQTGDNETKVSEEDD